DVFRAWTGADATAVFIIVPVDDVVTTVLNRPVTAVDFENLMRAGLLGGPTGDAVGNVQSAFSSLFLRDVPLDDEGLAHVRKVEVIVQFRGGPDFSGLASFALMTDDAHHMSLLTLLIQGVAHRLAVDGQTLISRAIDFVPALQGLVQMRGGDADQHIAQDVLAGHDITTLFATAAK